MGIKAGSKIIVIAGQEVNPLYIRVILADKSKYNAHIHKIILKMTSHNSKSMTVLIIGKRHHKTLFHDILVKHS